MTNRVAREGADWAIDKAHEIIEKWLKPDHMRLHAGEMSAQEVRSARAVLKAVQSEIDQI